MAKRTKPTTRTTITRSGRGQTTRTTTTRSTYEPGSRRATRVRTQAPAKMVTNTTYVTKTGSGAAIFAIIIVLLLLAVIVYLLLNSTVITYFLAGLATPAQQQSQFASQLSTMQNNTQSLGAFYLANAPNYQLPVNQSWSVQVTDQGSASSPAGQLTISWNGVSKSLSIQNGIVNTGISPTYAVTLTHPEFMSFSQAVITKNTGAAISDYSTYFLSGNLKYIRVN